MSLIFKTPKILRTHRWWTDLQSFLNPATKFSLYFLHEKELENKKLILSIKNIVHYFKTFITLPLFLHFIHISIYLLIIHHSINFHHQDSHEIHPKTRESSLTRLTFHHLFPFVPVKCVNMRKCLQNTQIRVSNSINCTRKWTSAPHFSSL